MIRIYRFFLETQIAGDEVEGFPEIETVGVALEVAIMESGFGAGLQQIRIRGIEYGDQESPGGQGGQTQTLGERARR